MSGPEESKTPIKAPEAAADNTRRKIVSNAFPSTAFREPILRMLAQRERERERER